MSTHSWGLSESVRDYLLANSLREPELLTRLRSETANLPNGGMQISPEQGQFMALLVQLLGARRTLEIGVFTGYSALSVALALPPDGQVVALDVSAEWTAIGRRYWNEAGVAERVDLRLGPALASLETLPGGSFDFAFIDADKVNYARYFEHCLRLVRPGGLIAVDNVLWSGAVADPTDLEVDTVALRAFNASVHADARVDLSMVPIGDGLTLCRVRQPNGSARSPG